MSNDGRSSGESAQHFSANSKSSAAAVVPPAAVPVSLSSLAATTGRNGGHSRAHTLDTISVKEISKTLVFYGSIGDKTVAI